MTVTAGTRPSLTAALAGAVVNFVAFFAALALVCGVIRKGLPFPDIPTVRAKVEHLEAFHDQYDTLIFGSSRLAYQVLPAQFDRLMAEAGHPTRTFNAAVAGMNPPEDAYMLETILRDPPKNLRLVILELAFLRGETNRIRGTKRASYWRDWPRTLLMCQRVFAEKVETGKKKKVPLRQRMQRLYNAWSAVGEHLELFGDRAVNLGRGSERIEQWLRLTAPRTGPVLDEHFDGWVPTGRGEKMEGVLQAEYEQGVVDRRARPARRDDGNPETQKSFETMIAQIEKSGARVVLIIPPTTASRTLDLRPDLAKGRIILDYSDLQKYPALYASENRLDTEHLNLAGSQLWTQIIASELVARLKSQP